MAAQKSMTSKMIGENAVRISVSRINSAADTNEWRTTAVVTGVGGVALRPQVAHAEGFLSSRRWPESCIDSLQPASR